MTYTYHLYHIPTNKHYYGARYAKNAHVDDLWVTYFTSSKTVKYLIEKYGVDSFVPTVRKIFDSPVQAILWENKFLTKVNARNNEDWLNQHNGNGKFLTTNCTEYRANQISKAKKGKKPHRIGYTHSAETCKKISESNIGREPINWTAESREKISSSMKKLLRVKTTEELAKRTKNSWSSPLSWTQARKDKISKNTKGKKKTKTPKLLAAEKARKYRSKESKIKCGAQHKGRTWQLVNGKRVWMNKL